ncbi:hypothetical protein RVU55_14410 [Bordetella avium]|nr:hypothetical protein [Bordetella avium]
MLQRAMLVAYRSSFYTDEALSVALEMATAGAHGGAPWASVARRG